MSHDVGWNNEIIVIVIAESSLFVLYLVSKLDISLLMSRLVSGCDVECECFRIWSFPFIHGIHAGCL